MTRLPVAPLDSNVQLPPSSTARSRIDVTPTPASTEGEAGAVVDDLDDEVAVELDVDIAASGVGVADGVGDRFGRDAVGGDLDRRGEAVDAVTADGDVEVGGGRVHAGVALEGADEAEVVQPGGRSA